MACSCIYDYDARSVCVDAWDLEKYYSCNESPTPVTDCDLLQVGDSVEISIAGERIWSEIVEKCDGCSLCCDFVGKITSELILEHQFSTGDLLLIALECIYNHIVAEENKPDPCPNCKCPSPYSLPRS